MLPLLATHSNEGTPSVVASLYPACPAEGSGLRYVLAATLEPHLWQVGQSDPSINVAFRRYEGREQIFDHDFVKLTVTDARELVTALQYLIETAERG